MVGGFQTAGGGGKLKGVGVWVTKDASKLNALVTKPSSGDKKIGSHDGATVYRSKDGSKALAVDGATLVVANSQAQVDAALDRHANGNGMKVTDYNQQISGLPSGSLVQISGNVQPLLATPQTTGDAGGM